MIQPSPPDAAVGKPSVVVTGGSSGIGAAVCRSAALAGWHVWVGYASGEDRARRLVEEIAAENGSATAVALPLDDPERLRASVAHIAEQKPDTEAAVLCGAPAPDVLSFIKLTPDQFRRQLECAVVGNHTLMAELWRRCFRRRGGGHVLAVLSAAQGPETASHMASYVSAKGGLETLLRAAVAELGQAGLRISLIRPGYVETAMLGAFDPRLLERARETAVHRKFLEAEAVAGVLLRGLQDPPASGTVAELAL